MAKEKVIDYDRGVIFCNHPQYGMDIYMYVDNPGEYITAHGMAVSEKMAKEAGFDTVKFGKLREKRRLMAIATAKIEADLQSPDIVRDVVKEAKGLAVVHIGHGRFQVEDADHNKLHDGFLPEEVAVKLLDDLAEKIEAPAEE